MSTDINAPATPRPPAVLAAALLLGVLGEYLFSPAMFGLNVLAWAAALAAATLWLAARAHLSLRGEGRWLLVPALLAAGFVAWRSSPALEAINLGSVAAILAVAAFRMREGRIRVGAVTEYLWLGATATFVGVSGLPRTAWATARTHAPALAPTERSRPVVRAVVLTVPALVVFGALLASADELFADALSIVAVPDIGDELARVVRAIVWAWIAGGFLYASLVSRPAPLPHVETPPALRLGPIEVSTLLGVLDILFLAFVAFQVRYLFGGAGHVQVTEGLTYAEYARHGFFELLAVAALVLPLVLGVHWLLRDSSPVLRVGFRVLAAAMVLLLYVIIASALQRMRVYVDEFGLTELRLYSTAFMLWLVVVFVWLAATILRDHRRRFAFGALAAGLVLVASLNVLNPDAFIVDTNLDRAEERDFDAAYAVSLSPDATPTLVAALPRIDEAQRCFVASTLLAQEPKSGDWRTWNYGRERARDAVDGSKDLRTACDSN